MRRGKFLFPIAVTGWLFYSCAEYTPKPRGYFRIEPPVPSYVEALPDELPYSFHVSTLAEIELPLYGEEKGWINLSYPTLNAKVYCSYLPVTPSSLGEAVRETQELLVRQAKDAHAKIARQAFDYPEQGVHAAFYFMEGDCPSPMQFTLTDSARHFFRGALYYNGILNADSLEPVTSYLTGDMVELVQTFCWKN
ncbi:hypothetical protein FACS1894181_16410 [Bacteroidia bacterium]|nr:hypothetical protein FACS1894181_16410 [Bacteroidia bacterium]